MTIPKNLNFKEISSFLMIIFVVISLTRLWAINLFYIFGNNSVFIEKIVNDRWHHYQVGLILVLLSLSPWAVLSSPEKRLNFPSQELA